MYCPSSPPQQQHHEDSTETDGSTDEILNSSNLTLDKEEIAQDLLPNESENIEEGTGEESLDDLHSDLFPGPGSHASDSPGSYGTHRLLRCKSLRCKSSFFKNLGTLCKTKVTMSTYLH